MNFGIEIIRLIAVILITFTHIRHSFTEGPMYFILEEVPRYGTLILSVISGYLYFEVSKNGKDVFKKKVKNLLIPFLIANIIVIVPVLIIHWLGYDYLNRLSFDYTLITEGLLSLNSPPVNPPTYFIRDLFIVFILLELVVNKKLWTLIVIIPLIIFGQLLIRYDILILFLVGVAYSKFKNQINHWIFTIALTLSYIIILIFYPGIYWGRHLVAIILFINIIKINFKFIKTGGYTYLLHLYHTPIIVFSYPFIVLFTTNIYLRVVFQILLPVVLIFLGYLLIRNTKFAFINGGR